MSWKTKQQIEAIDSQVAALEIMEYFKQWVENNKGWEVIQDASSRNREKFFRELFIYLVYVTQKRIILI